MSRKKHTRGFFLIEVIVAATIITVVLIYVLGSIQKSVEVSQRALEKTQASYLLEEGAEAIKGIRDNAWSNVANLTVGATYYLSWNGSAWTTTTTPETINTFTRSFTVSAVSRDATTSDIVSSGGVSDIGTKLVTVKTSWTPPSGTRSETLSFYISNIRS
jgi:Tfp pilus assembly protein PilV